MSNLVTIYEIRQRIGKKRQARHAKNLENLDSHVQKFTPPHPYGGLDNTNLSELMTEPAFANCSRGKDAEFPGDRSFLYSISNVKKVVRDEPKIIRWKKTTLPYEPDDRIFDHFTSEYNTYKNWLPLNWYAEGKYTWYRGITWWTSFDSIALDIVCSAHKLGITDEGITKYSLLLRCPISYLKRHSDIAHVPTVLDAFLSAVFHPTKDDDWKGYGVTINLEFERKNDLGIGEDEYVLQALEVDQIEMIPIAVTSEMRDKHKMPSDSRLWKLLEEYYKKMEK